MIPNTPRAGARRRLLRVLGVVLAPVAAIVLIGQPAHATQACTGQTTSNVCLTIDDAGGGLFRVTIGIDWRIGQVPAQQIIDAPGDPFTAAVFADDSSGWLFSVPITNVGASADAGLSAEGSVLMPRIWLDEDFNDVDEVLARVKVNDSRFGVIRSFSSPQIQQSF
ncbi:hypothetical protein ACU635_57930 [[Actinomadura] parvosata]|uniref:hypothetical protein n=1 Tax=[Actinomadura] parvosata TaxID=1955412 RepID=UPI00406D0455